MKRLLLIALLLLSVSAYAQLDTSVWSLKKNSSDGKYSLITNKVSIYGIGAGSIVTPLAFDLAAIDTSIYQFKRNQSDGKYSEAVNKVSVYGIDSGLIKVSITYGLNSTGISLSASNTWTGTQTFQKISVDTMFVNYIDSVQSTYWINGSGDTIGFVDAGRDSISFKKMYIKDLSGETIITTTSVTTNTLYSDTIIGNSPIFLMADSVIAQNKIYAGQFLPNDATTNIGSVASKFDSLFVKDIKLDSLGRFYMYQTNSSASGGVAIDVYKYIGNSWSSGRLVITGGNNILTLQSGDNGVGDRSLINASRSLYILSSHGIVMSGILGTLYSTNNKLIDIGTSSVFWRNTFTASLTLGIDSIGASKSDTIYAGRNTMIVNCDASNNDTVFLANIGITDGFTCTVKKVDANATYVVVKPKGGLTIDGATEDKFNTQWQSKSYIYKNNAWYIK